MAFELLNPDSHLQSEVYLRKWYVNYIDNTNATRRMIIDAVELLPKYNPFNGVYLEKKYNETNVTVSWVNKNKKGQILNHQNQPTPIVIPRYFKLDKNSGGLLGLYFGDGTKNDPACVEFSNSSPELIKLWLNHLANFAITTNDLSFTIKVSENVKVKWDINEEEVEREWRRFLNIPLEKEILVRWIKAKGTPSSYLKKYGTCVVRHFNTTFSVFYNALIKNIPKFLEVDEQFRVGFIRGIIASDGNINTRRNGSLSLIRIAGNDNQREFLSTLLLRFFNIRTKEDKNNQIYFGGVNNLRKVDELDLYSMHPEKGLRFEQSYKKLLANLDRKHDENVVLNNKTAILILKVLREHSLKTRDIYQQFRICREWLRDIFNGYRHGRKYRYNGLKELGLVSYKRSVKSRREKIWLITKKGKIFLKSLNQK